MTETPPLNATLIVIDPGSSLFKVISSGRSGNPEPLAIRPELVSGITQAQADSQMAEYGDDALRSAWIETGGTLYAVGDFATDLAGRQYHELSKWDNLLPRILVILGLVLTRKQTKDAKGFARNVVKVKVSLLLPRDEINPPDRTARIEAIVNAAKGFRFRGKPLSCELEIGISTEGAGLFVAHAVHLQTLKLNLKTIDIPVIVSGERNTSILTYRGGKLNPTLSTSDGDGFYKFAEQLTKTIGKPIPLPRLIRAIALKQDRIRGSGNEGIDISTHVPEILEAYASATIRFLKAKLPNNDINCIAGGGAFSLIWDRLEVWFKASDIPAVYIGSTLQQVLQQMFKDAEASDLELDSNPTQMLRFADALGLYKSLAERARRQQSQPAELVAGAKK